MCWLAHGLFFRIVGPYHSNTKGMGTKATPRNANRLAPH